MINETKIVGIVASISMGFTNATLVDELKKASDIFISI